MKITLKKVLYCGFALLVTLCFFLMLVFPVTLRVGDARYSGSFLQIAFDNGSGIAQIIRQDALATAIKEGSTTALINANANAESLTLVYQVVGLIGFILVIVLLLTIIGVFFIPSMKWVRRITIPLFSVEFIFFIALISFGASLGVATREFMKPDILPIKTTYWASILLIAAAILFAGMLIVPGLIGERVLFEKRKEIKKS